MYEAGTFVHAAVRCNPRKKMFRSAYLNNRLGAGDRPRAVRSSGVTLVWALP